MTYHEPRKAKGGVKGGVTGAVNGAVEGAVKGGAAARIHAAEAASARASLVATVVGFDYQRTLVAAAASLLGLQIGALRIDPPLSRDIGGSIMSRDIGGSILSRDIGGSILSRDKGGSILSRDKGGRPAGTALFVGLGAGSCAAALHALGATGSLRGGALRGGALHVEAVEYDAAVLEAAWRAHGIDCGVSVVERPSLGGESIERGSLGGKPLEGELLDGGSHHLGHGGSIHVTHADAATYAARRRDASATSAAPLRCVVLDAYDGCGNVPNHLQQRPFLEDLAALLREGWGEGGSVQEGGLSVQRGGLSDREGGLSGREGGLSVLLANLWNGSASARASCDAFARLLETTLGPVFSLRVLGHEDNLVLLSAVADGAASVRITSPIPPLSFLLSHFS